MLAIDTETTGLFIHKGCKPFTVSAACDQDNVYLWKFRVIPTTRSVIYHKDILADLQATIDAHEELIFHNANFDIQALEAMGIKRLYDHKIHDTMVMSHAYHSNGVHGLKELGISLLEFPDNDEQDLDNAVRSAQKLAAKDGWCIANKNKPHPSLLGLQRSWHKSDFWVPALYAEYHSYPPEHPWRHLCDTYAKNDAMRTIGIFYVLQELMTSKQKVAYHNARKLIKPILDMQKEKITLLPDRLEPASVEFRDKYSEQINVLRELVNDDIFNPNSPKQLSHVLFQKFKFRSVKSGKNGPSTDKNVISTLFASRPIDSKNLPLRYRFLLELLKLRKIKATKQYLDNYITHRNKDSELQPFFKQTGTDTNRLSCENPNTTNVGTNDTNDTSDLYDEGNNIESFSLRNIFGPRYGNIWTCIDYQQFQLLIFAVASGNNALVDAYLRGEDLHDATARQIFESDDISKQQRRTAKNVNFGILFGAGPKKIEQTAGIPGLYDYALSRLPGSRQFLDSQSQQVRSKGYVHTLGGYRLYVPRDRHYAASCYVIQGTEAEIVRQAMVDINSYTYSTRPTLFNIAAKVHRCLYRMIMMVHDELVFRSPTTDHIHLNNIKYIMETAGLRLGVPVKTDIDIVIDNWAEPLKYKGACPECNGAVLLYKSLGVTKCSTCQEIVDN